MQGLEDKYYHLRRESEQKLETLRDRQEGETVRKQRNLIGTNVGTQIDTDQEEESQRYIVQIEEELLETLEQNKGYVMELQNSRKITDSLNIK